MSECQIKLRRQNKDPTVIVVDLFHGVNSLDLKMTLISITVLEVSRSEFLKPVHCWSLVILTAVLTPPLDTFIRGNDKEQSRLKGVPCASPVCGNRGASFIADDVAVFDTDCLVCSLYQIPSRERRRENIELLGMETPLLQLNHLWFALGARVLLGLQDCADVEQSC